MPRATAAAATTREEQPRKGPGAPPGERHGLSILTDQRVRDARHLSALGVPTATIAKVYGVAETTMRRAIRRTTWRHLNEDA
jgi:hypothetical protein